MPFKPMKMSFNDIAGSLYSGAGLRFGGFQTAEFLSLTDDIERMRPGVRNEIIAEADCLAVWPHRFPEIAFFLGALFTKSLLAGCICFIVAVIVETFRFYYFGAYFFIPRLCKFWDWVKIPLFLGAAIFLWPAYRFLSVAFIIFLLLQVITGLVSNIFMIPIRMPLVIWLGKRSKHTHFIQEALALQWVFEKWRAKILQS